MKYIFIFILFNFLQAKAQINFVQKENEDLKEISFIPDKHYGLQEVQKLSAESFVKYPMVGVDINGNEAFWLKFYVQDGLPKMQDFSLFIYPQFFVEVYYFNSNRNEWLKQIGGLLVVKPNRLSNFFLINSYNRKYPIYVKVNTAPLAKSSQRLKFNVAYQKQSFTIKRENEVRTYWLITLGVISMFFLYNLYLYFLFRDKSYLYYLLILFFGAIYITGLNGYFNELIPIRLLRFRFDGGFRLYYHDLNSMIIQIGIVGVITAFIQFTRVFLKSKQNHKKWDVCLQLTNLIFITIYLIINLLAIFRISYILPESILALNYLILIIMIMIMCYGIIAYRGGFRPARYFLLANTFPYLVVICLTIFMIFNPTYGNGTAYLLPNLAILSQTLTFAIALVARVNSIKNDLRNIELETVRLKNENEQIQLKNKLIETENSLHVSENEVLKERLAYNNRELATVTMQIFQKNELLHNIQSQINLLINHEQLADDKTNKIKSIIQNNFFLDADWEKFKIHFEQVHPSFFEKLKQLNPKLTVYETRLCAYYHLKLSTKEIALLLNINPDSVHKAKMRLSKKINLDAL